MNGWRTGLVMVTLGIGLAALLASDATTVGYSDAKVPSSAWTEVKWPFLLDQWGRGKAYHCAAADCGTEVKLYMRAKIGFCNCATGVADDAELDRVGDLEIFSDKFVGLSDGREISVAHMKGRSRPYRVDMRYEAPPTAVSIGFNDRCDVVVATVVADRARLDSAENRSLEFLNSERVMRWVEKELGL